MATRLSEHPRSGLDDRRARAAAGDLLRRARTTTGVTLIELSIALVIFATLMVLLLQSMTAMAGFGDQKTVEADMELDVNRAWNILTEDFANSAWFYPYDSTTGLPALTATLPVISKNDTTWGDSITFVKLRTERSLASDPSSLRVQFVNFNSTAAADQAVPMSSFASANTIFSMILNGSYIADGSANFVGPVWESNTSGLSYADNLNSDNLRQYRYTLQANDRTGLGDLVRQYRNAPNASSATWSPAEVILENVQSASFDSELTASAVSAVTAAAVPQLNPNQIRVSISLLRNGGSGGGEKGRALRTMSATIAMRSVTNNNQ